MKTAGITACSNGLAPESREQTETLIRFLKSTGREVQVSPFLYGGKSPFSGTGEQRAKALTALFSNPEVEAIYDISGGDMANEVLDYLDFEAIGKSKAVFWGYSDLTVILNAIFEKTGKPGVLYSPRNLVHPELGALQRRRFLEENTLFMPVLQKIQGGPAEGILVGGNLRCLLKLAGTDYFPELQDRILLMESLGGRIPQMVTYLSQLRSLGAFHRIRGIILGTFTEMEDCGAVPDMISMVREFAGPGMPITKTGEIGHGPDAKAIWIGKPIQI